MIRLTRHWLRHSALCGLMCATVQVTAAPSDHEHLKAGTDPAYSANSSNQVLPGPTPQGLKAEEWASIQKQIQSDRYGLQSDGANAVSGINPEQRWSLKFQPQGLSLRAHRPDTGRDQGLAKMHRRGIGKPAARPKDLRPTETAAAAAPDYQLQLRTTAIGRAGHLQSLDAQPAPNVQNNRVEFQHSSSVTEWYLNTAAGIEHGYTFQKAPAGERGEVQIELVVEGGLRAQAMSETEDAALLTDAQNKQRLRYHKLQVVDAQGQMLAADLEVASADRMLITFDDSLAVYPVVVDPLLVTEEARLVASDSNWFAFLGYSAGVSGDTAVVGAPGLDAAYVFVRNGTTWTEQQKLTASDGEPGDFFGEAVAVSGDTVLVRALYDDGAGDEYRGSTYVFVRNGTTWTEQQKLPSNDGVGGFEFFGSSVALLGNTAVVGAPGSNEAYVFERIGTTWTQQQKLVAENEIGDEDFGASVTLSDNVVVVGAPAADTPSTICIGFAYIFVRDGTTWTQRQKLRADDGAAFDFFGNSVAGFGDTVVIGGERKTYVFGHDGGKWTQRQKLNVGGSVAVSGNILLVGSYRDSVVFVRGGTTWMQRQKFQTAHGTTEDYFGNSVAVSGDTVVVGAPFAESLFGDDAGAAYIYRLTEGTEPDTVPDHFNFRDLSGVKGKTWITSSKVRVSGLDEGVKSRIRIVTQTGGDASYSINGGAFRTSATGVKNGDRIRLRNRIQTRNGTADVKISVGGVRDTWDITTAK